MLWCCLLLPMWRMTSKLRECQVTKFLANFCMPWMSNGKQSCAHPSYDGKVCFSVPFLAFLHRLVDLCKLTKGRVVKIVANWQGKIEAGLYALIHLFDPVDVKDLTSNHQIRLKGISPHISIPIMQGPPCFWCTSRQSNCWIVGSGRLHWWWGPHLCQAKMCHLLPLLWEWSPNGAW